MDQPGPRARDTVQLSTGIPWSVVLPAAVGLLIGIRLGTEHAWQASSPRFAAIIPPDVAVAAIGVIASGGLGLLGLVLWARRSLIAGRAAFAMAGFVVVGGFVGVVLGPRYQYAGAVAGHLTLNLTEPRVSFESDLTCWTVDNGTTIASIEAADIGHVGVDQLGLQMTFGRAVGTVELRVNERAGYVGNVAISDPGPDLRTGTATFTNIGARDDKSGGASEGDMRADAVSGTLTWSCNAGPDQPRSTGGPSGRWPSPRVEA